MLSVLSAENLFQYEHFHEIKSGQLYVCESQALLSGVKW